MIDINNSQEFDAETFAEELAEEKRKLSTNALADALGSPYRGLASSTLLGGVGSLSPSRGLGMLSGYSEVLARAKRELTDPIEFIKKTYPGRSLWRFILTHPDLDHMRGLKQLHDNVGFDNLWDTKHTKPTPTYRGDSDRQDWEFYQLLRGGSPTRVLNYTRGDSLFAFGKEESGLPGGDNIEILSPTPEIIGACNTAGTSNDLSIVLRIHHAGKSILLPGDAEELSWDSMRDFYGVRLKSDTTTAPSNSLRLH
jgi:hypothetical protein